MVEYGALGSLDRSQQVTLSWAWYCAKWVTLSHPVFSISLWDRYYYYYPGIGEEPEAQRI